jgi:hypothetical protein
MNRDTLAGSLRSRLKRYAGEMSAHYGVISVEPPEGHVDIRSVAKDHAKAVDTLEAADVPSLSTHLHERAAYKSMFVDKLTLDELDPAQVNGLEAAREEAA